MKICIKCIHHHIPSDKTDVYCRRKYQYVTDKVTGNTRVWNKRSCWSERDDENSCGSKGIYWEPKKKSWWRFWK